MSRFLCLSDDNYRLIAFYLVRHHWEEAVALFWKRKRIVDVDDWTKAVPLPSSMITKKHCKLQRMIINEIGEVHRQLVEENNLLHLHEFRSVKSTLELYKGVHEIGHAQALRRLTNIVQISSI
jgi:hypothetical protein